MDVYLHGKKIALSPADFKAQGGEGAVYVKNGLAYKIYADPAKMIPPAKLAALSVLDWPDIVRPQQILADKSGAPVGYTMAAVPNSLALCQTFPPVFKRRAGLTDGKIAHLVENLREGIRFVHKRGILIVDLNEMNFLVDPSLSHVYFIDVDSYQTPQFPATALMDSVRDRHASVWNEGTDWFSFAIVSFQMFAGIHPYKGKHPALKTLDERMQRNVSVFHPDVSLPAVCPPLSTIPAAYRDWYQAVFEAGERSAPPTSVNAASRHVILTPRPLPAGTRFTIKKRHDFAGTIVSHTDGVTVTTEAIYVHERRVADAPGDAKIAVSPITRHAVLGTLTDGRVHLRDLTAQTDLPITLLGEQLMATGGRLYVKSGGSLHEITFAETASRLFAAAKPVGAVLESATQLFEGAALQNLVGAWYASLLPDSGRCYQVRLPTLDGHQIIQAKFERGVLMVVAAGPDGRFQALIFRFTPDFSSHDLRIIPEPATYDLNFAVLDSGLCLSLSGDGTLEVFPAAPGKSALNTLTDPALTGDCLLLKDRAQALFARAGVLYEFSMKQHGKTGGTRS